MALTVEFKKSRKTVEWDDRFDSILELSDEHGVEIDRECMQGFCGTCKTSLLEGEVDMETTDGLEDQDQYMILPCVAVPITNVVIDA